MKTVEKICITCNKPFNANYYDDLRGMAKYCSKDCHNKHRRKVALETGARLPKDCLNCGKTFLINKGEITKGGGKYCSTICSIEAHRGKGSVRYKDRITKICPECKKKFEVHQCHETRSKFCSRSCAKISIHRNGPKNTGINRGKGGKRVDLDNKYFRSSWEANYARYLNFLINHKAIQKWEYEPDTFEFGNIKRGVRFYTPDFKVYNNDGTVTYHEVKGWMDNKSKTRMKRMNKYYPNIKVIILDKKWFRDNAKKIAPLVENWEKGTY